MVRIRKKSRDLPKGVYFVRDIELAVRNLVIDSSDMLPRRSGKSKIKSDRWTTIDGISKYLLRLLLMPNQIGARPLAGPKGKTYLWLEAELIGFGADDLLDVSGENRPTLEDILFLDVLPDTPATLDEDPDADDAYAYTSRVMQKYMLCVDPETWSVRRSPLFSLKNMQEYAIQSGFPTRMDFELQDARRAWTRTKDFAGAQLAMSFEYEKKPNEFRRPSEIARLVEKELGKLCVKPGKAKEEIFAEAYLNAFRGLSVSEQHLFTQAKAREISVPGFAPFHSNSSTGFVKAWSAFKGALTDNEFGRLPGPGRPRNPRT